MRKNKRYSIRTRLMTAMMTITIVSALIICLMSYLIASSIIIHNAKVSSSNICKQLADNISRELEDISERQFNAMWNYNVGNELVEMGDKVSLSHQMTSYLEYYITNPYVSSSILYTKEGDVFEPSRFLQNKEQGERLAAAFERISYGDEKRGSKWYASDENALILQQAVVAADWQYKIVGTQITEINLDQLIEDCLGDDYREGQTVVLCDQNGVVCSESMRPQSEIIEIFSEQQGEKEEELIYEDNKYLVYSNSLKNLGIDLYYILKEEDILTDIGKLGKTIALICAATILAASLTIGYLTKSMTKNINKLIAHIKDFNIDRYKKIEIPKEQDEISDIMVEFNKMSQKIQSLIEVNYNSQIKQRELEVKAIQFEYNALQSYINPHFLYNTLETISSMAKLQGEREISDATCLLGDLLREGIRPEETMFSLEEEISYIKKYLEIQKLNMGERLTIIFDIAPELYSAKVPKLILQPIVENAIMHGLEDIIGCGVIKIRAEKLNGDIRITISDNGKGIPQEKLEEINDGDIEKTENIMENGKASHIHIGIKSVQKRIQILYGKEYGVKVVSGNKGTKVDITIPFKE
ncbi:hypothetical protein GPL15_03935 [Clostridium sp. MCC353]|uniref:sensor histidine kinase n=1 Tax=Clostridium sp. MCC353 TaxID=2592646 RepID=UPI001C01EE8E|nr:sensor histidine kinase [Clostridium sp. MCC353]MBT9775662.1 hypothetical protein [Clostridium sp. MCC353]